MCVIQWLRICGIKDIKKHVNECVFYFKWFLIGKFHCPVSKKTKLLLKSMHKIFWGIIVISLAVTMAHVIEILLKLV